MLSAAQRSPQLHAHLLRRSPQQRWRCNGRAVPGCPCAAECGTARRGCEKQGCKAEPQSGRPQLGTPALPRSAAPHPAAWLPPLPSATGKTPSNSPDLAGHAAISPTRAGETGGRRHRSLVPLLPLSFRQSFLSVRIPPHAALGILNILLPVNILPSSWVLLIPLQLHAPTGTLFACSAPTRPSL